MPSTWHGFFSKTKGCQAEPRTGQLAVNQRETTQFGALTQLIPDLCADSAGRVSGDFRGAAGLPSTAGVDTTRQTGGSLRQASPGTGRQHP